MKKKLLILILLAPLLTYAQTVAPNGKPVNFLSSYIDRFYTNGIPKRPFFVGEKGRKIKTVIVHLYNYEKSVEGFVRPNEEDCHYRFDYDEFSHDKRFVYEGDLIVSEKKWKNWSLKLEGELFSIGDVPESEWDDCGTRYFYDNKDRLSLMRYSSCKDCNIFEVRYHYNDKGLLDRATENKMGSSNVREQYIYEYDINGFMVKAKQLGNDGRVRNVYEFSYNDLGLLQPKGAKITYDKDKNVVKVAKYDGEYCKGIVDVDYDVLYYDEPFDSIEQKIVYKQYQNHFSSVDDFLTIARNNNEGTHDVAKIIEQYFDKCNVLYNENQQLFESRKDFDFYASKSINTVLREIELRTNIQKLNNLYDQNKHYFANREEFDKYANSGYDAVDSVITLRKLYEQNKMFFTNKEEFESYAAKGINSVQERVDMLKLYEQNKMYFANKEEFESYAAKGIYIVRERIDMLKIYDTNKKYFANREEFESYAAKGINAVQERVQLHELYEQNKQYFKSEKDYWQEAQQGLHHIENLLSIRKTERERKESEMKKSCIFVSGKANMGFQEDVRGVGFQVGFHKSKRVGIYFEDNIVNNGNLVGCGGILRFGEYVFWQLGGGLYDKKENGSHKGSYLQTDLLFLINKNKSSKIHMTIGIGYSCIGVIEYIQSISNNNGDSDLYHNFHLNFGLMLCL